MFRPNEEADTNRKDPIFLKKLGQGYGAWSTRNMVIRWDLDMIANLLRLPPRQQDKLLAALEAIPRKARTTPQKKWRKFLGLLHSITLAFAGSRGMFTRVQHSLKRAAGSHLKLITDVHGELQVWCKLVRSLAIRPTHLRDLDPFPPTWMGNTDASGSGMGGLC